MPRVYTYKTRARRKHADSGYYTCSKCGQDILPGQDRYEWSFRYGGTYRRHVACGMPRQSELTLSKMAQVYAAQEDVEDLLMKDDWTEDDVRDALENAAAEVDTVVDEYREAAENFGGQGENADRADELESYSSDLQQVDLPQQEDGESMEDWQAKVRDEVDNALAQCPY